ncbi:MAG: hypothetical protein JXA68_08950 [Ignavibacteriales bacterium]|nr:hypothetical protein [Ignavibacteriales bacterium]
MKKLKFLVKIFLLKGMCLFFLTSPVKAQLCLGEEAFLCLGYLAYSGIYAGWGVQFYNAEGLNHYIEVYNANRPQLTQQMDEFGMGHGFLFGANIARFQADELLFNMEGFYQRINEKEEAKVSSGGIEASRTFDLDLDIWGIGMNVSYFVNKNIDIKFIDVSVLFISSEFENIYQAGTDPEDTEVLNNVNSSIGVNLNAGITFYLIPPYISIEPSVGYSFFGIDEMEFENGSKLANDENSSQAMDNFISSGGLYGSAQLIILIPL